MAPENRLVRRKTQEQRERVISALQSHFALDHLDVEEFERRLTVAHSADTDAEIEALVSDLPALAASTTALATTGAASASVALALPQEVPALATMRGIMSATTRRGQWVVPQTLIIKSVMSATELDFRDAKFPAGPVDIHIQTVMSSVELTVPPGLAVEADGFAILGSFEQIDRVSSTPDPNAPRLRVHGRAILGSVEIRTRMPGQK